MASTDCGMNNVWSFVLRSWLPECGMMLIRPVITWWMAAAQWIFDGGRLITEWLCQSFRYQVRGVHTHCGLHRHHGRCWLVPGACSLVSCITLPICKFHCHIITFNRGAGRPAWSSSCRWFYDHIIPHQREGKQAMTSRMSIWLFLHLDPSLACYCDASRRRLCWNCIVSI